jgi:hypothetical protein
MNYNNSEVLLNNYKTDKSISTFIAYYYIIEALNLAIKLTLPISDTMWRTLSNGFMIVLFLLMLFSIGHVIKRVLKQFILTEIVFLFLYTLSYLQGNADSSLLLKTGFRTLAVCIPLSFYVYSVRNKEIFYNTILRSSYLIVIILSFVSFISMNKKNDAGYSMSLSYALLLPTLLQINEFFKYRRLINLTLTCIAFVAILLYGARGPLLCITTMIMLKFIIDTKNMTGKISGFLLTFVIIGLIIRFSNQIGKSLLDLLAGHNIYSRTIYSLVYGEMMETSGRDLLFKYYWKLIQKKPILGWGLLGGWIDAGYGPHNMLLEYLLAFVLCIFSISLLFITFFINEKHLKDLFIIYCSFNIVM